MSWAGFDVRRITAALRWLAARLEWALRPRGKRRVWVLLLGWALIIGWQVLFATEIGHLDRTYSNRHAIGMTNDREFLFFLRHLGLYPLKTRAPIKADTRAEAERQLREEAPSLMMEEGHALRMGDRGQIYLLLPDSIWKGTTLGTTPNLANAIAFTTALCALFAVFWWDRRLLLGAMLVLALGSNPYQLHETHQRPNVFGWGITAAILLLAAHLPLLRGRLSPLLCAVLPIASGLFLATVRTLRSEPLPLAASVVALYLFFSVGLAWRRRLLMSATFVAAMVLGGMAWNGYFKFKFNQAARVVAQVGGVPYTGPFVLYHPIWHNLALGLGDFDRKKGWKWTDQYAYTMGVEELRKKYKVHIPPFAGTGFFLQDSYDGNGRYPVLTEELPHYYDVIRDRVLADISGDPFWYLDILVSRVKRILTETTPLQVALGRHAFGVPWNFLPVLPLFLLCFVTRRRYLGGLLLVPLPLSVGPLLIYSGDGATYTAISHLVGAAIFLAALGHGGYFLVRQQLARRRETAVDHED